jgi:ATP/maltotriose-dependent transcriptional regulator MalT
VYEAILPGALPDLHERLARALAEEPGLGGGPGELARHWEIAGRPADAFAASVEAARAAEAVYGLGEALEHLERALRLWHDTPDAARVAGCDRARLLTRAAELADLTGRGPRAVELIRGAIEQVDEVADPARAGALYARLGSYQLPTADREAGLQACRRSVALVPADPPTPERTQALTILGSGLMLAWRHTESERACREAVSTAEALGDPRLALRAYGLLGVDWCYLGRRDEALAQVRRAREQAQRHGSARDVAHIHAVTCEVLIATGCVAEAGRVALDGRERASRLGAARSFGALLAAYAAEALFELGDWDQAESLLTDAHRTGTAFWPHYPHLLHAQLATARGCFTAARHHLDAGGVGAVQPTSAARHTRVVAELAIWEGRPDEASKVIDDALRAPGRFRGALQTLSLATVGLWAEADRAQIVRTPVQTDIAARYQGIARRAARRAATITPEARAWQARAEAERSRLDGAGDPKLWRLAVEAWEQLDRPYHAAYCRWRLAEALLARVPAARAECRLALRASHRTATALGAVPLRRMVELAALRARLDFDDPLAPTQAGPAHGLGLTNREVEVLRLLTRGYTNRDIAGHLTISVKTASVHVSHILAKLGVSRRVEAAAIGQRLWTEDLGAEPAAVPASPSRTAGRTPA